MNRSPEQIKQSLFALTSRGIKYDLERIADAAGRVRNPHNAYRSIHIAGTNGKGSTCAFIESILRASGFTTGLFTSPHIVAFEERFRVGGEMIEEEEWVAVYNEQRAVIEQCNLTFFEATMLIGSELFRRRNVDWAIFETGMGGRLDATNILHPAVTVITRIAMDHREYLGNTIAEIAGEKLGIVKENTPLVIADPHDETLRRLMTAVCKSKNAPCTFVAESDAAAVGETAQGCRFMYKGAKYTTAMAGRFQVVNALLAIEAIMQLKLEIDLPTIRKGVAAMFLPGRFQRHVVKGKTVVIDVGHNPDAAKVLCETLQHHFPGKSICIVAGIMADKEYTAMIELYASIARHIIFARPKTDRAERAETLARHVPEEKRSVCPDVGDAVDTALRRGEEVVCVTGSFFTVGEAIGKLEIINDEL